MTETLYPWGDCQSITQIPQCSLSKTIISETGLNAKSIGYEESCIIIREIMHNHQ